MIKGIHLQNFQSHPYSVLDLHPGVNIIVGSSDSGKTAIIRAIRWVNKNRPSGNEFMSHWGGETRVDVLLDGGQVVSRNRTKTKNSYEISHTESQDYQELKAFGTEVPPEVLEALNLSDTTIQGQLDVPFLLTNSPGEVATHFNKVAHLEDIDHCIKNIQKDLTAIDARIKYDRAEQTKRWDRLVEFEYLERYEAELEVLESMEETRNRMARDRSVVKSTINSVETIETEIQQFTHLLDAETAVNNILSIYQDRDTVALRKNGLGRILKQIEEAEIAIQDYSEYIEAESQVDNLLALYDARDKISTRRAALIKTGKSIATLENTIKEKEESTRKLETQFAEAFPDICPLCDTNLKEKPHTHDKTKKT